MGAEEKDTRVTRRSSMRVSLNENSKTKNIMKRIFFVFLISFRLVLFEERRYYVSGVIKLVFNIRRTQLYPVL